MIEKKHRCLTGSNVLLALYTNERSNDERYNDVAV